MKRAKRLPLVALVALVALLGLHCAAPAPERPPAHDDGPRLVVLLVVDQFRYDYMERFSTELHGGLRWLHTHGVWFENANYDHAGTVTAAGHATIATGLHPSRSGIIGNGWYDPEAATQVYSFEDPVHGRSPVNLLGTTLADWIKETDPAARAFSLSHKDRTAIALAGHAGDGAYWFDTSTGRFVSSTYYPRASAEWLEAFNEKPIPEKWFGRTWSPLELGEEFLADAGIGVLDEGAFTDGLPDAFGSHAVSPGPSFYEAFRNSPFADQYLLQTARELIVAEELGQQDGVDFLGIGLSVLDSVGHAYGPDSRELVDTVLRLDGYLEDFFDFLDREVGLDRVVIGFSSDHGVLPIPEYSRQVGAPGVRFGDEERLCYQKAGLMVREKHGLDRLAHAEIYLDRASIEAAGAEYAEVESDLARELEKCPYVERVWTRTELEATRNDEPDHFRRLYRHSFHTERSGDLVVQLEEHTLAGTTRATHGSPYPYDTHVPLAIALPDVEPASIAEPVKIADLAPTLAAQIGIAYPADLDGSDLSGSIADATGGGRTRPTYVPNEIAEE